MLEETWFKHYTMYKCIKMSYATSLVSPNFMFFVISFWGIGVWTQVYTIWATPPVLFALIILKTKSHFLSRPAWTNLILWFWLLLEWQVHTTTPSFFLLKWDLTKFFSLGFPRTVILLISASWVTWDDRCTTVSNYWLR
jgi:hypothetical protein